MTLTMKQRLIHLHECRGIGVKTLYKMIQYDPDLSSIYRMSPQKLQEQFHISPRFLNTFYNDLHNKSVHETLSEYNKKQIFVITIVDKEYPFILKNIYLPPPVLYYQGDLGILNRKMIAIVGTRTPTDYGIHVVRKLVPQLVKNNYIIVSGLAKGIDYEAHLSSIHSNGKTVAVLGGGFHHIYPKEHTDIATEISKNHLLLTEYPPYVKPHRSYFPSRNRIISGLSLGTVVIEAMEKSGSLITAQLALEEGREVFAVPGPILSSTSRGTNKLIQEGAKLVLDGNDILSELPNEW